MWSIASFQVKKCKNNADVSRYCYLSQKDPSRDWLHSLIPVYLTVIDFPMFSMLPNKSTFLPLSPTYKTWLLIRSQKKVKKPISFYVYPNNIPYSTTYRCQPCTTLYWWVLLGSTTAVSPPTYSVWHRAALLLKL